MCSTTEAVLAVHSQEISRFSRDESRFSRDGGNLHLSGTVSFVRGYDACVDIWEPEIGKKRQLKREPSNIEQQHQHQPLFTLFCTSKERRKEKTKYRKQNNGDV